MNKMLLHFFPAILCFYGSLAAQDKSSDSAAIRSLRMANNKAMLHHDIKTELSMMTDDYIIVGGDGTAAFEKDSVYRYFLDDTTYIYQREPSCIRISPKATMAYESGVWTMYRNGENRGGGHYTASWRKEGGVWKIRSEIFVTLQRHPARKANGPH